ncbi:hypothetical protein SSCI18S_03262 [Sphingobium scionense]
MSADALLSTWLRPSRQRVRLDTLLLGLPGLLLATTLVWRLAGLVPAAILLLLCSALLSGLIVRRARRFDQAWLVRRLDARRADLEDSSALLFADPQALGPLQRLQRSRLDQRLGQGMPEELAPDWSRRMIIALWAVALLGIATLLLWPRGSDKPVVLAPAAEGIAAKPGIPRLVAQNLRIIPPAYTGLSLRDEAKLDARAPLGTRLEWTFRFDPQANAPALLPLGGAGVALRRDGEHWIASRTLDASFLYRVDPASGRGPLPPLHRIDGVVDAPPQVKLIAPAASLNMVAPGQRSWTPVFAATDDYGVAATARLRITLAIGEGENIRFTEREIAVSGTGAARDRRFAPRLDFGALGFRPAATWWCRSSCATIACPRRRKCAAPVSSCAGPRSRRPRAAGCKAWSTPLCRPISAASARSSSMPRRC